MSGNECHCQAERFPVSVHIRVISCTHTLRVSGYITIPTIASASGGSDTNRTSDYGKLIQSWIFQSTKKLQVLGVYYVMLHLCIQLYHVSIIFIISSWWEVCYCVTGPVCELGWLYEWGFILLPVYGWRTGEFLTDHLITSFLKSILCVCGVLWGIPQKVMLISLHFILGFCISNLSFCECHGINRPPLPLLSPTLWMVACSHGSLSGLWQVLLWTWVVCPSFAVKVGGGCRLSHQQPNPCNRLTGLSGIGSILTYIGLIQLDTTYHWACEGAKEQVWILNSIS